MPKSAPLTTPAMGAMGLCVGVGVVVDHMGGCGWVWVCEGGYVGVCGCVCVRVAVVCVCVCVCVWVPVGVCCVRVG